MQEDGNAATIARRRDETSINTSVSPQPVSSTGGRRRPMTLPVVVVVRAGPSALPNPLDSGGGGKQRVGAQSNGGGSFKPRGGKQEASERQAERSVALWTKQSGAQVPLRRAPHSAPTPPASLYPPAGTSQQNKHTSTPHPEPLSEHMILAVWCRGMRNNPRHQPRHHPPRILCSVSASASGWGAQP